MFIHESFNSRALTLMSKHTAGTNTHMEEEWREWNAEPQLLLLTECPNSHFASSNVPG